MQIEVIDPDPDIDTRLFTSSIDRVFLGEQKQGEYVNVIFMKRDELRAMKRKYFNLDLYTDVIAFNLNDPGKPIEGEIYLCLEQIKENAIDFKTEMQTELHRVLIHGCLHLCGYEDNSIELKAIMTNKEDQYLSQIDMGTS